MTAPVATISRSVLGMMLLGLGAILFAVSAKLALVQLYGTDQPFADQWAAEGMYFLRGPLYYDITFEQLISLHGEHRPGLTRLWARGLIVANDGQWDCFLELVANLLIYAAFLALIWKWLLGVVRGRWLIMVGLCMAVLFGLPCAYENFLWGFQSSFLFLLMLGMLHILGAVGEKRMGFCWWAAHLAGLLALFSVAAGAMSAGVLVLWSMAELLRGRRGAWIWSTLFVNIILFGLGYWLLPNALVPEGSWYVRLTRAVLGSGYLLSWPFPGFWWSVLLQAPWVILLIGSRFTPENERTIKDGLVGIVGLWVASMAFAIAYGRAVNSDNIGVRYYDVLVLGLFVNIPALIRIIDQNTSWRRFMWGVLGCIWLLAVSLQLRDWNRPEALAHMFNYQRGLAVEQAKVVREFLGSNDPTQLQEFENTSHRFPHFQTTLDFLRDSKVPPLLPPSLTPDGHQSRFSRLSRRIAVNWPVLMGLGAVFFVLGAFRLKSETLKTCGAA